MKKLPIPQPVIDDPDADEIMSVWIVKRRVVCSLKIGTHRSMEVDEEVAWGRILADAARHVADAMNHIQNADRHTTLMRIMASFEEQLESPVLDTPRVSATRH